MAVIVCRSTFDRPRRLRVGVQRVRTHRHAMDKGGTSDAFVSRRRGGTSTRFSKRLLNWVSGLAGFVVGSIQGYEPQSSGRESAYYDRLARSNQKNRLWIYPEHSQDGGSCWRRGLL